MARIISVADTYDVMTARDSYRTPVSSFEAIQELQRVAGAQLDARFVEIFIELLEGKDLTFRHGEDADFERRAGARGADRGDGDAAHAAATWSAAPAIARSARLERAPAAGTACPRSGPTCGRSSAAAAPMLKPADGVTL